MPNPNLIFPQRDSRSSALDSNQLTLISTVIESHLQRPGALLPILHAVQDDLGFIPADAVALIAEALNLSRAEVHGVITFYHHFRSQPAGKHIVQLCRAEACQAVGARALETYAKNMLGIDFHETTADGAITLEATYCLGNCACGPSLRIDDDIAGRVTPQRFDEIVMSLRAPTTKSTSL
jgi:formate dehydrogenase subunit gamma